MDIDGTHDKAYFRAMDNALYNILWALTCSFKPPAACRSWLAFRTLGVSIAANIWYVDSLRRSSLANSVQLNNSYKVAHRLRFTLELFNPGRV